MASAGSSARRASRSSIAPMSAATSSPDACGRRRTQRLAQPLARSVEVPGDPQRVAADAVDEGGRELDQALVEGALGGIVGAHPGRLEELVGLEEVAPLVRGERRS